MIPHDLFFVSVSNPMDEWKKRTMIRMACPRHAFPSSTLSILSLLGVCSDLGAFRVLGHDIKWKRKKNA